MRAGSTYRAARRNAAFRRYEGKVDGDNMIFKKIARDWRTLPLAMLQLKHSKARIIVRAVPTLTEPPKDHPKL